MTDELDKALIQTERGPARDLTRERIDIGTNGRPFGSGKDWFGPLAPPKPMAPPEVAGRVWDYVPGYNLTTQPRAFEEINFAVLRAIADNCDVLRLIIERRKDQIGRMPWTIRPKHDEHGRRPKTMPRDHISDITAFFKRPDYDVGFRPWLRALLEDLFVIDAPSVFLDRDGFGSLVGLRVVDGSTIKRVIDEHGRMPRPLRWTGQPFTWNGLTVDASNYTALGFKVEGGLIYPPAYQQVLKGLPAVSLTARDMLYRPLNARPGHVYGFSPVEQVLRTVNIALHRTHFQLEYYREGNMPEGFYSLPSSWTPDQVSRFQDYFDNLFVGNFAQRRRIKFLSGDGKYQPVKEAPLKTDFDEWLTRVICFAFSYPVSAFVHQINRATAEQHEAQAEKEGLEPVKQWAADLFNEIIEREFGGDDVEFAWVEEEEVDQKKEAEILTSYADSGAMTLNEVRERIGEEPSSDPAASVLAVKTANGRIPISAPSTAKVNTKTEAT